VSAGENPGDASRSERTEECGAIAPGDRDGGIRADPARADRFVGNLLLATAVAFALPSLAYPFGRDQALYHYVARGWFDHGLLPYRNIFDQKPPGIYLVYGIAKGNI
jgi:hypothetical protein